MKKIFVVVACLMALAVGATAQQQINFSDLPLIATPAPIPAGYADLNWSNFWYVDPSQYGAGGPGYQNPFTHRDVAFVGGQFCGPVQPGCYGVITSLGGALRFFPSSAVMAAGYHTNQVTVLAYNQGTFVGSATYRLTTAPRIVGFPSSWGAVTEMQIQTDTAGDLVLFDLIVYPVVQDPPR